MATHRITDRIRVVSFNMHGFNQGRPTIDELIANDNVDIFLLQEHWLTPSNLTKFDVSFVDYFTFGCSAMSRAVESGILRGRPFGGVMIMIKNSLRNVSETIFCCDRYAIVRVADWVIVNMYLPCVGSNDRLLLCEEILADILEFSEAGHLVAL